MRILDNKKGNCLKVLLLIILWYTPLVVEAIENIPYTTNIVTNIAAENKAAQLLSAYSDTLSSQVFIKAIPNKQKVYQGESFILSYKLYHKVSVSHFQIEALPPLEGCRKEHLPFLNKEAFETINGRKYRVVVIQKYLVEPLQAGSFIIPSLKASVDILFPPDPADFFGGERSQHYTLASAPITLEVVSLPLSNRPKDFKSAVGRFEIETLLASDTTQADQPISFKIKISGKGNFHSLEAPAFILPKELELYTAVPQEDVQISSKGYTGQKIFTYTIVGAFNGVYKLPAIQFSYFDTQEKVYKTLASRALQLTITGGKPLPEKNKDVLFAKLAVKSRWSGKKNSSEFWGSRKFYILLLTPLMAYVVLYTWKKWQATIQFNTFITKKQAFIKAQKELLILRYRIQGMENDYFYKQLSQILYLYLVSSLELKKGAYEKEIKTQIYSKLSARKVADNVVVLIEELNRARFSLDGVNDDERNVHLKQTIRLINNIQNTL